MSPAASFELIVALTGAALGLELLARRLPLPPAASLLVGGAAFLVGGAALLVGGAAMALLPGIPAI